MYLILYHKTYKCAIATSLIKKRKARISTYFSEWNRYRDL